MDASSPAFVAAPLDRAELTRKNPEALAALIGAPQTRALAVWRGRPLLRRPDGAGGLVWLDADFLRHMDPQDTVFLGLDGATAVFAAAIDAPDEETARTRVIATAPMLAAADPPLFADLRGALVRLPADDASLAGLARWLLSWRRDHVFCGRCGATTQSADGGWKRRCPSCGHEMFARINPVVIMAIIRDDALLLGRQAGWPPRFFSCLAGFVEPGETLLEATRRESWEEAGIHVQHTRCVMEQPWPFPGSLMLGLAAFTRDTDARPDHVEIEAVRWFDRCEAEQLLAGAHPDAAAPPPFTIAHHLIRAFAEDDARMRPGAAPDM